MAAQKKLLTKGQIVTHFAEKFEISKKAAASMLDYTASRKFRNLIPEEDFLSITIRDSYHSIEIT